MLKTYNENIDSTKNTKDIHKIIVARYSHSEVFKIPDNIDLEDKNGAKIYLRVHDVHLRAAPFARAGTSGARWELEQAASSAVQHLLRVDIG